MRSSRRLPARGSPLVLLVMLLAGWSGGRALWWENPFASDLGLAGARSLIAAAPAPLSGNEGDAGLMPTAPAPAAAVAAGLPLTARRAGGLLLPQPPGAPARATTGGALADAPALAALPAGEGAPPAPRASAVPAVPAVPPFLPAPMRPGGAAPAGRWSLDAWAFWRQGSDAALVSEGRVPIYGANQAGAVLQYRLAPASARDPRLYARAYRALVQRGESEVAAGASLRPLPRVPVRVAGELRYTDAAFFADVRPAAFAMTELAPLRLPLGAQIEAYGQAGWVGGAGATPFADGFAALTRELPQAARLGDTALRLSLGMAAWGGAQRDAERLDMGPTLRLDAQIGKVPARLMIDWRARVAGDASPGSGVAATLSTGF